MSDIVERARVLLDPEMGGDPIWRLVEVFKVTHQLLAEVESLRTELKWVNA